MLFLLPLLCSLCLQDGAVHGGRRAARKGFPCSQAHMQAWPSPRSLARAPDALFSGSKGQFSASPEHCSCCYTTGCIRIRVDCCCRPRGLNPGDVLRSTSAAFPNLHVPFSQRLRSELGDTFLRRSFSNACIHPRHAREWSLSLSCRASDPSPLSTRKTCRLEEQQFSLDLLSQPCPDSSFRAGFPHCPIRQT